MGDPATFRSGREFAAWLGLVPRHTGTGGRVRMLGISKRRDTHLRTLLIHGARSTLLHGKLPSAWAIQSAVVAFAATVLAAARSARPATARAFADALGGVLGEK